MGSNAGVRVQIEQDVYERVRQFTQPGDGAIDERINYLLRLGLEVESSQPGAADAPAVLSDSHETPYDELSAIGQARARARWDTLLNKDRDGIDLTDALRNRHTDTSL